MFSDCLRIFNCCFKGIVKQAGVVDQWHSHVSTELWDLLEVHALFSDDFRNIDDTLIAFQNVRFGGFSLFGVGDTKVRPAVHLKNQPMQTR